MEFIFCPTAYEEGLEDELSRALEKRTEILSRAAHPELWEKTDQLNEIAARGAKKRERMKKMRNLLPWVLLILGLFLLIPGLMDPQGLKIPLLVGTFAVALSLMRFLRLHLEKKQPSFHKAARRMLQNLHSVEGTGLCAAFREDGLTVSAQGNESVIGYDKFEMLVETPQLFLLTYSGNAILFQKKDMTSGSSEDFAAFFEEKSGKAVQKV